MGLRQIFTITSIFLLTLVLVSRELSVLATLPLTTDNTTAISLDTGDDIADLKSVAAHQIDTSPNINKWQVVTRGDQGTGGWTPWSKWSTCSRTCDGGVSHQLRRCNSYVGCHGEPIRYKICNMQPCSDTRDFREHQCAAFNDVPYEGSLLKWTPHYDETEPCALTCRGHSVTVQPLQQHHQDMTMTLTSSTHQHQQHQHQIIGGSGGTSNIDDNDDVIIVQLAPKVQDGTRCRPGSLDMCINGQCERVGCDLRIGSTKKVDSCGVCGGDGTSCAQPLYLWQEGPFSLCSVTCGGGYKMSRPVCRNRQTAADVDEQLCDASSRPEPRVAACHQHRCPPRWVTAEWSPCSASCGGGTQTRVVQCIQQLENGTKIKVPEHGCRAHKPKTEEECNTMECPSWHTTPWSGCSVSCGEGQQVRTVECYDHANTPSEYCNPENKPKDSQVCSTGITCTIANIDEETSVESTTAEKDTKDGDVLLVPGGGSNSKLMETHRGLGLSGVGGGTSEISVGSSSIENIIINSGYHPPPLLHPYPPLFPAKAEKLIGEEVVPSEATFITGEWGPCSCTEGIRRREVNCKIFLEFSKTLAKLPDDKCAGPKPPEIERCPADRCYGDYPVKPGSYSWKEVAYADCSASCLGGTQEMIIMCINDSNQKPASPFMCSPSTKPLVKVRTCNDHPCPPRWNYSDFQPCTKSCGMGIQTRDVNCIHEITSGAGNTLTVPNSMCPQPPPPDRQYCNVLDCPIKWEMTEWTKCSKSCGGGIKERKVECKQVMAQNHIVERPEHMCSKNKPPSRRPCNTKSCVLESDKPFIQTTNNSYIQHDTTRKKVTVKVGASATVFYGITLKIKCPVKRYDRSKIRWAKDQNFITKSRKYKLSKKGALRIQNLAYKDSGIYTCFAGQSSADVTISVKPRPGEFPSSEEIDHANRIEDSAGLEAGDVAASRNDGQHRPLLISGDDQSHEQKPGDPQKYPKKQQKVRVWTAKAATTTSKPPAIVTSQMGHVNQLDALPPNLSTTLFADQQESNSGVSAPPETGDDWHSAPSSSSSRPMPHFQQLLTNLQTFTNSRGHRMVSSQMEETASESHEPHYTSTDMGLPFATNFEDSDDSDDFHDNAEVLGKGTADNLKFNWMITDWSECSLTCGGDGYQMRAAHCMLHLNNLTRDVNDNLCEDAGLDKPQTVRTCGGIECPKWVVTDWTPCAKSRCFTWNTAMQKRDVSCQTSNYTKVEPSQCNSNERPPQRQECYNDKCKGVWRVGEWSECAASCEAQGIKYRILQCVWYGTKKAAGNACREQLRPAVMKMCKGPPCPRTKSECIDHSKFCQNVKAMNMCRVHRYQYQCCHTCSSKG